MSTSQPAAHPSSRGEESAARNVEELRLEVRRLHQELARLEKSRRPRRGDAGPAPPLPWRARWMPRFLDVLRATGNVSAAIRAVPRSRRMVYEYRKRCAEFAAAWQDALARHEAAKLADQP